MTEYLRLLGRFVFDEDGPTAVEYAIMLAMIILVCFVAIGAVGSAANRNFEDTTLRGVLNSGS